MPIFNASPSMVNVEQIMKETFGMAAANNNNHLLNNTFMCHGLSEDDYINNLIIAVEKRPVLYNVHLLDYKNKNKKGEAFKEVQQVMRAAGCSEQQVQGTYKKWISLKRKFRVEFFKPKSEDSREASCTFPYYDSLKFLIPYCEAYRMCKTASKRKATDELSSMMNIEEDESDDERYGNYDEESNGPQSALDLLISQKRVKLESLMNSASNGLNPLISTNSGSDSAADSPPPTVRSPQPPTSQQAISFLTSISGSSPPNLNTGGSTTSSSATSRRSTNQDSTKNSSLSGNSSSSNKNLMSSMPGLFSANETQQNNGDDLSSAMGALANYLAAPPQDDSPNALFGRLVANELDKLPVGMHNIIRAQVLLLLAQSSQQSPTSASNATDRILACLTP